MGCCLGKVDSIDEPSESFSIERITNLDKSSTVKSTGASWGGYSDELLQLANNLYSSLYTYQNLESEMRSSFRNNYGAKVVYLYVDPRIRSATRDFESFYKAIFYIGQGAVTRPFDHLKEAAGRRTQSNMVKIRKIIEIWENGIGVNVLVIFSNISEDESKTREASMIAAIGINNLTNKREEKTFLGVTQRWSSKDRNKLGSYCIYQAFEQYGDEDYEQIEKKNISNRY